MTDWSAVTRAWVDEGLLREDQRAPILDRLTALPPPTADPSLPIGPIVTLLLTGAIWLMTGSAIALLAFVGSGVDTGLTSAVLGLAGAASAVGGGAV
ncbi:MAG: hypothetical protein ABMB14_27565, partial [Myxococcota bacterium]